MTEIPKREAIFISHASPEDNAFALWLGAKLAAIGYEVWADIMRLHGGCDWSRELEEALRKRAIKMLLVCTPIGLDKQGVRNEIGIGAELGRELNDREFIIPLRLEPYKPPFQIVQAQYIDFSDSWAKGFAELNDLLVNIYKIPKCPGRPMESWLATQSPGASRLVQHQERLISNWLYFRRLPRQVRYCEPPLGFPVDQFQKNTLHHWPIAPFKTGVLTFACPNDEGLIAATIPARIIRDLPIRTFLENGWDELGITPFEARKRFSELGNQAFAGFLQSRGLTCYEGSRGRHVWWGNIRTVPLNQIRFDCPQEKGRRQIIGQSEKRGVHWHYAISAQVRTAPIRHLKISARLIFSENGLDPLKDTKSMHRLRRSFAKSWRNARWRDMQLAFLWWLADSRSKIGLSVSHEDEMLLALPPMSFSSPVSILQSGEDLPDEDDPDIELDDWDGLSDEAVEDEEDDSEA